MLGRIKSKLVKNGGPTWASFKPRGPWGHLFRPWRSRSKMLENVVFYCSFGCGRGRRKIMFNVSRVCLDRWESRWSSLSCWGGGGGKNDPGIPCMNKFSKVHILMKSRNFMSLIVLKRKWNINHDFPNINHVLIWKSWFSLLQTGFGKIYMFFLTSLAVNQKSQF